jgi:hypothetical protein
VVWWGGGGVWGGGGGAPPPRRLADVDDGAMLGVFDCAAEDLVG